MENQTGGLIKQFKLHWPIKAVAYTKLTNDDACIFKYIIYQPFLLNFHA